MSEIFMSSATAAVGYAGSAAAVVGGGIVAATAPDPDAGQTGLIIGVGGLLMGAATLLGTIGDKWGPHAVTLMKIWLENRAANIQTRQSLATATAEIAGLKADLESTKAKANENENLAIEARARAAQVEKEAAALKRAVLKNSSNISTLRTDVDSLASGGSGSGSGDHDLPGGGGPTT